MIVSIATSTPPTLPEPLGMSPLFDPPVHRQVFEVDEIDITPEFVTLTVRTLEGCEYQVALSAQHVRSVEVSL